MELKDVQDFINSNAGKPEVQEYIRGFITPDGVKAFIDTEAGMKVIQPRLDQYFTKGLETWKTNNLQTIVDEKVNTVITSKYPNETEEQKRLKKLESDLASETSKRQKAELLNLATREAQAKGLPADLVKYFLANDENGTKAALQEYEETWKAAMKKEVDSVFKQFGRTPEAGNKKNEGLFSKADVEKMTQREVLVNRDKIHESMKQW